MKVRLYYPAFRHGQPPIAFADGEARETATQIIVERATVTDGHQRVVFDQRPRRFRKKDLRPIPWDGGRGWRVERPE